MIGSVALALVTPTMGAGSVTSASRSAEASCGQTVTASVTLASDLVGCAGSGLVVGAAGITIDLGGHTLRGTNAPKSAGIENNGYPNVRIVNGTISGFRDFGVAIRNARGNTVDRLTVRQIGEGNKESDHLGAAGVLLDHSPGGVVTRSVVTNNVNAWQSDGVDVLFSRGTRIEKNRLSNNAWNGLAVIQSPSSRVIGNTLDHNANNGLEANTGNGVSISGNGANRNVHVGLVVGSISGATVGGNSATANGREGLFFFDLARSSILGNTSTGNAAGIALLGGQHGSTGNRIVGNQATRNRGDGIGVNGANAKSPANGNLLSGNTASANRGQGVVVDGSATANRLQRNVANGNARHGISAVAGSIDGGGNRARANRVPPQCVGVACA